MPKGKTRRKPAEIFSISNSSFIFAVNVISSVFSFSENIKEKTYFPPPHLMKYWAQRLLYKDSHTKLLESWLILKIVPMCFMSLFYPKII